MNIYESIAAVQSDVEFIGKDKQVQSGGSYKYRGVDQVLNTLHPLFAKHKVFAVPEVLEIMEREIRKTQKGGEVLYQVLKVKYSFFAEDGTSISATVQSLSQNMPLFATYYGVHSSIWRTSVPTYCRLSARKLSSITSRTSSSKR